MEFEKLRDIIVEVLNVDETEVTMESTFIDDLGADSLDVFQIIMGDRKSTRLNSSHNNQSRMPSSA